jgi:hypothetical protein
MPSSLRTALALSALALALARPVQAQGQSANCPDTNLLAGRSPTHWQDAPGDKRKLTDGKVTPEGAQWNSTPAIVFDTGAGVVTYDLGAAYPLQAVLVQADANDVYHLWGSTDGRQYTRLPDVPIAEGVHGLRTRTISLGGQPVRWLRFGEGVGDAAYSLSELQAFCRLPTPFPPKLTEVPAPPAIVNTPFWNNESSALWELILAILGFALLVLNRELAVRGTPQLYRRLRDGILMGMGGIALLTYFNMGSFHFGNAVHDWEWTHYYVGSKYFTELSYDRLYECIAVADYEEPVLRRRVEIRKLTNLRTNALEGTQDILAHPDRCRSHFTDDRWQAFRHDVKFFRDRQTARRWDDLQTDHGYNATPVWNILGSVLSNLGPASVHQLYALLVLDPLYLLAAVGVIWWAFGWRVTCVALLVFATNFPSRFYWTGGSFLRWDWLFYLVAGICCLKKDRPLLAGLAVGYATLLRVFPGFMMVGPLLAGLHHLWKKRELDRTAFRFFAGAALAAALLIPISLKVGGGTQAYVRFVQNTAKHKETPLTNYMGLRTVVNYRFDTVGRKVRDDRLQDPWIKWKQARLRGWQEARWLAYAAIAAFLVILGFAVKERPLWMGAALGVMLIPFGVELTCYYYAFILGVALLHAEDDRVGITLLGLTAITGCAAAPWLGAGGLDEQYTLMSLATIAAFVIIAWRFGVGPWWQARKAAAVGPETAPTTVSSAVPASVPASVGPAASPAQKKKKRR